MTSSKQGGDAIFPGSGPAYGAGREPDRWLVTINGQAVSDSDMRHLRQPELAALLAEKGERDKAYDRAPSPARSDFVSSEAAKDFHREAAREFPEDDVRLWASVESTSER